MLKNKVHKDKFSKPCIRPTYCIPGLTKINKPDVAEREKREMRDERLSILLFPGCNRKSVTALRFSERYR